MERQWGVYIHIPFCRQKCFYCDFPSVAGRERYESGYIDALCREITVQGALYRGKWGTPATIYMGGGTPSVLPFQLMETLLKTLQEVFALPAASGERKEKPVEFTVECNPGTIDLAYLTLLHDLGVNRLSFGVQTFDDALLKRIGRIHTGAQAREDCRAKRRRCSCMTSRRWFPCSRSTSRSTDCSLRRARPLPGCRRWVTKLLPDIYSNR